MQKDSYVSYIEEARSHPNVTGQIDNYEEAIALDPMNGTAYLELLNQVYLLDDNFTSKEDEQLRQLLITQYDNKRTYEQMLATDEKA